MPRANSLMVADLAGDCTAFDGQLSPSGQEIRRSDHRGRANHPGDARRQGGPHSDRRRRYFPASVTVTIAPSAM